MKLLYATSINYPSERANRNQTVSVARAFATELGDSFLLAGSDIKLEGDSVRVVDLKRSKKSYSLGWSYQKLIDQEQPTHIFSREERLLFFISFYLTLRDKKLPKLIFEMHEEQNMPSILWNFLLKRLSHIVVLTNAAKDLLVRRGVAGEKIIVAPDGVDIERFQNEKATKEEARAALGLPQEPRIVMYMGSLQEWKGYRTLLEASKLLPPNVRVVLSGGSEEQLKELREEYSNAIFLGPTPVEDLPRNQHAADLMALPNTARESISVNFTSPLKLFTYMASGVPIVASDLPSLRDVISEENAYLVKPDNPEALAEGIMRALENREEAQKKAELCSEQVKSYTWEARVKKILEVI